MASLNNSTDSTLTLPRILCLHGGGVNATIFKIQLRGVLTNASLKNRFRFVFVEAPFICEAGWGVSAVFGDNGPFRRWFRWLDEHPEIEDKACQAEVLAVCKSAMEEDNKTGASGDWVGTLGFSQGAKMAASLLYEMQIADEADREAVIMIDGKKIEWRFGIIFAGRAPLVALSDLSDDFAWCQKAGGLPAEVDLESISERPEMKLRVPTVHIHGLKDEGLDLHRKLVDNYCAPLTTTLVEWDGPHRLPLKKSDVEKVVEAIVGVADEYGI